MSETAPLRLRSRPARALVLLAGATVLGPCLPAFLFVAMAEIGGRLEGPHEKLALSFPSLLAAALSFAYLRGGGAAALLSGLVLALVMLWRGAVNLLTLNGVVALVAALVAGWADRHGPRHEAPFLVMAFVLVALTCANVLQRAAIRLRLTCKE